MWGDVMDVGAAGGRGGGRALRAGLVLGAGGVVGTAFHAGVLAAIAEATGSDARRASVIVATSAGSVTGTALRAGLSTGDILAWSEGGPLSPDGARLMDPARQGDVARRARRSTLRRLARPDAMRHVGRLVDAA